MEVSTWIALAAAVFGGAGVKVIEKYLNRETHSDEEAGRIRQELRDDLNRWKTRAEEAEAGEDKWRDRYYKLLEEREPKNATDNSV